MLVLGKYAGDYIVKVVNPTLTPQTTQILWLAKSRHLSLAD